jgi:putative NADH-flavin reductase
MNIAILGAPGCVGRTIIKKFLDSSQHTIIASYRIEEEIPKDFQNGRLVWKQVDLLNQSSAENFLQGTEILIYLIHSLGAKNFEELDIRLAILRAMQPGTSVLKRSFTSVALFLTAGMYLLILLAG